VKSILKSNISFLLPFSFFLLIGAIALLVNSKTDLHLTINSFHDHYLDIFFYSITYLGDGLAAILTVAILLTVRYRYAMIVGISYIISSVFTQVLKRTLFEDVVRPKKFFEGIHNLYFVPGTENHLYNSFPSGHATTAFALYFSLALIVKNNTLKFFLFVVALLVGFSRIYLSQHFLSDVYAGASIGVVVTFISYWIIQKNKAKWLDRSLVKSINLGDKE
jgi:membrane-associated phospholipid phosphatase